MRKRLPQIKESIVSNGLYKLVALVVAVAIWATTLHTRKDFVLLKDMNLEFVVKPSQMISGHYDKSVRVTVSGPRSALKKFSQSSGTITLNLASESEGRKHIQISSGDLGLPNGIKLISLQPGEVDITLKDVRP